MGLDANEFPRLQVECLGRGWPPFGYAPGLPRPFAAAPKGACEVIRPSHRRAHSDSCLAEVVVHRIDKSAEKAPSAHISRKIVFNVLTDVPPLQRFLVLHLRNLADISRILDRSIRCLRSHPIPHRRLRAFGGGRIASILEWHLDSNACVVRASSRNRFQPHFFPEKQTACLAPAVRLSATAGFEMDGIMNAAAAIIGIASFVRSFIDLKAFAA